MFLLLTSACIEKNKCSLVPSDRAYSQGRRTRVGRVGSCLPNIWGKAPLGDKKFAQNFFLSPYKKISAYPIQNPFRRPCLCMMRMTHFISTNFLSMNFEHTSITLSNFYFEKKMFLTDHCFFKLVSFFSRWIFIEFFFKIKLLGSSTIFLVASQSLKFQK